MQADKNLSNNTSTMQLSQVVADSKDQIYNNKTLTENEKNELLVYLDELAQCSLGQFLLINKSLNGYWTDYIINFPENGAKTGLNHEGNALTDMERFLLSEAPVVKATQERAKIFMQHNQQAIKNGAKLACIPCGLMGELLTLDYTNIENIYLLGMDIDLLCLQQAKQQAKSKKLIDYCELKQQDAWDLKIFDEFDLIISNGLSLYVDDNDKLIKLYQRFFDALKEGGKLVTSTLTPPPISGYKCEWDMGKIDAAALLKQTIILSDIVGAKWMHFRNSLDTKNMLSNVGFKSIDIIYDSAKMMPTLVAQK